MDFFGGKVIGRGRLSDLDEHEEREVAEDAAQEEDLRQKLGPDAGVFSVEKKCKSCQQGCLLLLMGCNSSTIVHTDQ